MEHDHKYPHGIPFVPHPSPWPENNGYHSHHQSPVHEYQSFGFGPVDPTTYNTPHAHVHRNLGQHGPPLIVPPWPSMLASSQATGYGHPPQSSPPTIQPAPSVSTPLSAPPAVPTHIGATRSPVQHTPTPRRTLTDADRRKMCLYHEEHPTKKQTEIGELFGVERSTVSKVLRQKDKYLLPDDGNRSPIKKPKGKFPDIERALAIWAKNQESKGLKLTDEMIRDQARLFVSATSGAGDLQSRVNSSSWLEKFKIKNNIGIHGSRKASIASDTMMSQSPAESTGTPTALSPMSMSRGTSPAGSEMTQDGLRANGSVQGSRHTVTHSQSTNSLSSVFNAGSPPPYSAIATSEESPIFTPDAADEHMGFFPAQNSQRSRSQTMPITAPRDAYISPGSSTTVTPQNQQLSPTSEMPPPSIIPSRIDQQQQHHHRNQQNSQNVNQTPSPPIHSRVNTRPPSVSSHHSSPATIYSNFTASPNTNTTTSTTNTSPVSPSQDQARHALEIVLNFVQNQSTGISVDHAEVFAMNTLMDKLKFQQEHGVIGLGLDHSMGGRSTRLPGGLHRIPEQFDHMNTDQDVDITLDD